MAKIDLDLKTGVVYKHCLKSTITMLYDALEEFEKDATKALDEELEKLTDES